MPEHFAKLPKTYDVAAVAAAVRDIVREIHRSGTKYSALALAAEQLLHRKTTDNAIRVFMTPRSTRINRSNQTLAVLYDYIVANRENFSSSVKEMISFHWKLISPSADTTERFQFENALGAMFRNWFHVSAGETRDLSEKLTGKYVMLRKSLHSSDLIVRSTVTVSRSAGQAEQINIVHSHMDRGGNERLSNGFVCPVIRNIYAILNVEHGEAIELIVLRNPIQREFKQMVGFLISINVDRKIISSRVSLVHHDSSWDDLGYRFRMSEVRSESVRKLLLNLDDETSLTLPAADAVASFGVDLGYKI